VFAVPTALLLLAQLWRTATGQLTEAQLVMVQDNEDAVHPPTPSQAKAP
jgi:TRAP-type transport system small permease protein